MAMLILPKAPELLPVGTADFWRDVATAAHEWQLLVSRLMTPGYPLEKFVQDLRSEHV